MAKRCDKPYLQKRRKTECQDYRGITVLSHCGKVERRLRGYVESKLGEWQHGFGEGRGTTDLIFALKMMMEKNWEWGKEKLTLFIDLEKAFDCAPREFTVYHQN